MNSSDKVVRSFVQLDQFIDSVMRNALAVNNWASPSSQAADMVLSELITGVLRNHFVDEKYDESLHDRYALRPGS